MTPHPKGQRRSDAKVTGEQGELLAVNLLQGQGLEIVATNYRFGHGEIDIIARDGEELVFCEVKARHNDEFGPPEYAITRRKQQQLRKIAEGYLFEHQLSQQACRFDVVAIRFAGGKAEINYIKNAF